MKATLFDIVGEFQQLYEMATSEEEQSEQVFLDTLDSLMGELETKSSGYVAVINQLEMEAKEADMWAKAFQAKKKSRENHIKRMKEALKSAMETIGVDRIDANPYTITLQKNGGLQPLVIDGDVPDSMMKIIYEPDNDKIREFLKDNSCDYAHLEERGRHIVIK